MKSLLLKDYSAIGNRRFPGTEPAAGEVLIRVAACGICGSDVHGYDGASGRRIPPIVMGHEAAGTVAAWAKVSRASNPAIASPSTPPSTAANASSVSAAK